MAQWTTNWFPVFDQEKFLSSNASGQIMGSAEGHNGLVRIFDPPALDDFRPVYGWWNDPDPLELWDLHETVSTGGGKLTEACQDEQYEPNAFEFLECFVPAGTPLLLIEESWLPLRDGGVTDYSCAGAHWLVGDDEDDIIDTGGSPREIIEEAKKRWPDKEIHPPR
jgi:hypothetical protein